MRGTRQHPLIGFGGPSTHEASESDPHRVCLARLCYAYRFSQPLDVSFRPTPVRFYFTPVTPLGFSLQRFVPLTKPPMPFGVAAPPGVVRTVEPQTMDTAAVGGCPPTPARPPFGTRSRKVPAPVPIGSRFARATGEFTTSRVGPKAWRAASCPVRHPTGERRSHGRDTGSSIDGSPVLRDGAAVAGRAPCDPQSRLSDVRTRGAANRPLRPCFARTPSSNDCTVGSGDSEIRRFGGLLAAPVRHRSTKRDSGLPRHAFPWELGRTRLQGIELRKSPCVHPPGVT
jgi:hypothetical protein